MKKKLKIIRFHAFLIILSTIFAFTLLKPYHVNKEVNRLIFVTQDSLEKQSWDSWKWISFYTFINYPQNIYDAEYNNYYLGYWSFAEEKFIGKPYYLVTEINYSFDPLFIIFEILVFYLLLYVVFGTTFMKSVRLQMSRIGIWIFKKNNNIFFDSSMRMKKRFIGYYLIWSTLNLILLISNLDFGSAYREFFPFTGYKLFDFDYYDYLEFFIYVIIPIMILYIIRFLILGHKEEQQ